MSPHEPPQRVTATNGPWPLFDAASSRAIERDALSTAPPHDLMSRAGLAVARLTLALAPRAQRIHVFAGPGNNGGDGLVAARWLHQAGKQVVAMLIGDTTNMPADAARALADAQAAGVPIRQTIVTEAHDLAIDALLGIGVSRAPDGAIAQCIAHVNASSPCVLAVDLPSGLAADSGGAWGDLAVRAHTTLSLLTLKPGCFTHLGRDHAGEMWIDALGVKLPSAAKTWLTAGPTPRQREHRAHKGTHGDVVVVGGAPGMAGAAWLASRAALTAGAGRVYCSLLDSEAPTLDPMTPELMALREAWLSVPERLRRSTVVAGCGSGSAIGQTLAPLLAHAGRLVLDADALNALAADSSLRELLQARSRRDAPTVLTPHPLEAARLLGVSTEQVQDDRLGLAQKLAKDLGATVVLKGSGTVIADPHHDTLINSTGNAALAGPGTGDVLAGWLAGLWAQQREMSGPVIGSMAAWRHGRAADEWAAAGCRGPLRASDLIQALARRVG